MKFPLIDVLPSVVEKTPPSEVLPLAIKYWRPAHSRCAMFAIVTAAFSFAEVLCLLWSPDLGFVDRSFLCECTNGQCHPNLHRCVSKYREQSGLSTVAFFTMNTTSLFERKHGRRSSLPQGPLPNILAFGFSGELLLGARLLDLGSLPFPFFVERYSQEHLSHSWT